MATTTVTVIWCDRHLAIENREVPATAQPEWADGLAVDLCEECAEQIKVARAMYEHFGSKGPRTPKLATRRRNAMRNGAAPAKETPKPAEAFACDQSDCGRSFS